MSETTAAAVYLEVAARIGRAIVADAIWHDGRCVWVGAMPEEGPGGALAMTYGTLGADLYGGTAGVGLTLAELHRATGEAPFASTAAAAFEHALAHTDEVSPVLRPGLYSGALGVAVACARAAKLLDRPALATRAATLARSIDPLGEVVENDLMGGRAGAVLAFLVLRRLLGDDSFLDLAVRAGDALLAAAVADGEALTWLSPSLPTQQPLTGLSHGAAGIGLALLELWHAAGERRYRDAAEQAFAYERSLYDPQAKNWPDVRDIARRNLPPGAPPSYATFWCHGAPGIAASRIRAYELTADEQCREEALNALETTRVAVRAELHTGNYSLCHGLAGNAELLLEGRSLIGAAAEEPVATAAAAGIERYDASDAPWPGGALGGLTPSLFLGLAGTAYFYLRLHDPTVFPLLLMRPTDNPTLEGTMGKRAPDHQRSRRT